MIFKSFEVAKINLDLHKVILLYGKNEGYKKQIINKLTKDIKNIYIYEEKEILDIQNSFLENISTKSLFEEKKIIIIKRVSDKILKIIEEIHLKNFDDTIIVETGNLEKKSKLRSFFEKEKNLVCIPFYPDDDQTLLKLASTFLKEKKISISQSNVNQIILKCYGDRENLFNELEKIEHFVSKGKILTSENISKLTNLSENFSISELIDNCLAKNKKKIIYILNENNYTNEDSIVISRTFLNKSKKILKLSEEFQKNNNIELTLSSARPPIFWKDKEIVKQQIYKWKPQNLRKLIYELSEVELIIKKNLNNSIRMITDFILEQSTLKTNN
tara:strand:- start:949 stop:1938 length:990 start_codon:yes stop_codon:yes gene_type:complete